VVVLLVGAGGVVVAGGGGGGGVVYLYCILLQASSWNKNKWISKRWQNFLTVLRIDFTPQLLWEYRLSLTEKWKTKREAKEVDNVAGLTDGLGNVTNSIDDIQNEWAALLFIFLLCLDFYHGPNLWTLKEPRNRFHKIDSARLGIDSSAGIFKQSKGARNRVGIGLSYLPARAEPVFVNVFGAQESIPRNRFRQPM
jgi:hypothetical protein